MRTNWTVAAREALGLSRYEKLPTHKLPKGADHDFLTVYDDGVPHPGHAVRLLPQGPQQTGWHGQPRRRMKHRLQIACLYCGCWIPTGRFNQHERACKQKDNYSI